MSRSNIFPLTVETRCIASLQCSLTGQPTDLTGSQLTDPVRNESLIRHGRRLPLRGNHINRRTSAAGLLFPVRETISIEKRASTPEPKPRMGFHMMNLLRRLVDVFRMDSIAMNALTGKIRLTPLTGSVDHCQGARETPCRRSLTLTAVVEVK
ncbi:MAG: hypothetical protein LBL04_04645 [Bacteroidales bacterium]|nr:hypothetical protein [Bacteroidales bacterium]